MEKTRRPRNVLLIVVDQWRADCVPYLGTPRLRTPNLDRLCREGVTFRNHVTTAVPCGPSRASLLTGLYLMNHRQVQNWVPLDARHVTLPQCLRACGHEPALVGYTTTTPDPRVTPSADPRYSGLGGTMEGWHTLAPFEPEMEDYFGWLAHKGFTLPADPEDIWRPEEGPCGPTSQPARIPAELSDSAYLTERALEYLRGRKGRPFFLHLGYYRPHPPFIAPAPYHAMYRPADMPTPIRAASAAQEAAIHPLLGHFLSRTDQSDFFQGGEGKAADMDEAAIRQMRATYYGLLTEVDDQLGRVLAWLDQEHLWNDTLVIFTSDHGEQLGDHYLLGKLAWHDESFRIPLVIRDPDAGGTRGRIVDAPTESIDIMPTLLDWLGGEVPHACDGSSLLPLIHGARPAGWRDALHYEFDFRDVGRGSAEADLGLSMDECGLAVLHEANHKYVHFTKLPPLLFDLREDPNQFVNLAERPEYAALVRDLAQRMLSWRMLHADRTLTHYRASKSGLQIRAQTVIARGGTSERVNHGL